MRPGLDTRLRQPNRPSEITAILGILAEECKRNRAAKLVVNDMARLRPLLFFGLVMPAVRKHRRLLAEAVRARRKEAGLSQEKLAEKADLSTVFISRIERGAESPSVDNLVKIARALRVLAQDLVDGF